MTFEKTNSKTWQAYTKNLVFYIDKETIDNVNYIYILTILDINTGLREPISFYNLNNAKQHCETILTL